MARRPSSVRLSVNFCANRFFSQTNGRMPGSPPNLHTMDSRSACCVHPGCAQGQGQRSRDARTFWILGMSYSVIDGLVILSNSVFVSFVTYGRPISF